MNHSTNPHPVSDPKSQYYMQTSSSDREREDQKPTSYCSDMDSIPLSRPSSQTSSGGYQTCFEPSPSHHSNPNYCHSSKPSGSTHLFQNSISYPYSSDQDLSSLGQSTLKNCNWNVKQIKNCTAATFGVLLGVFLTVAILYLHQQSQYHVLKNRTDNDGSQELASFQNPNKNSVQWNSQQQQQQQQQQQSRLQGQPLPTPKDRLYQQNLALDQLGSSSKLNQKLSSPPKTQTTLQTTTTTTTTTGQDPFLVEKPKALKDNGCSKLVMRSPPLYSKGGLIGYADYIPESGIFQVHVYNESTINLPNYDDGIGVTLSTSNYIIIVNSINNAPFNCTLVLGPRSVLSISKFCTWQDGGEYFKPYAAYNLFSNYKSIIRVEISTLDPTCLSSSSSLSLTPSVTGTISSSPTPTLSVTPSSSFFVNVTNRCPFTQSLGSITRVGLYSDISIMDYNYLSTGYPSLVSYGNIVTNVANTTSGILTTTGFQSYDSGINPPYVLQVQEDIRTLYETVLACPCDTVVDSQNIRDYFIFYSGVTCVSGDLNLSGQPQFITNAPQDHIIVRVSGSIRIASETKSIVTPSASSGNILLFSTENLSIGAGSSVIGTHLSLGYIELEPDVVVQGRLLAIGYPIALAFSKIVVPLPTADDGTGYVSNTALPPSPSSSPNPPTPPFCQYPVTSIIPSGGQSPVIINPDAAGVIVYVYALQSYPSEQWGQSAVEVQFGGCNFKANVTNNAGGGNSGAMGCLLQLQNNHEVKFTPSYSCAPTGEGLNQICNGLSAEIINTGTETIGYFMCY